MVLLNGKTKYWGNSYTYDAWGNLTNKTVTKCGAENLSAPSLVNNQLSGYGYDAAGNMTSDPTDGTHWSNTYAYDAWGNLQKTPGSPAGENFQHAGDFNNHIVGYSYDAAGNLLNDGVNTFNYVYDAEYRVTSAGPVTYTYDADGRRVNKSTGTNYWYGPSGAALAETDASGNWTFYVFYGGQRLARNIPQTAPTPADIKYYITDHLHSTAMFVDKAGTSAAIQDDNDFYPWGGVVPGVGKTSSTNTVKFTGTYRDSESQLDYFGARYYANITGRFMTPDWAAKPTTVPYADFGDPQSLNLYAYVRNSPIIRVDPDGHSFAGWNGDGANTTGGFTDIDAQISSEMSIYASHTSAVDVMNAAETAAQQQQHQNPSIASVADSKVDTFAYLQDNAKGNYKAGSNKCNQLVADSVEESGRPRPEVPKSGILGLLGFKRDPTAHEWADPNVNIPGWSKPAPVSAAALGDVIAEQHGQWGHAGIVVMTSEGLKTVSVNSTTKPAGIVTRNDWGFRPKGQNGDGPHDPGVMVRRYVGDSIR